MCFCSTSLFNILSEVAVGFIEVDGGLLKVTRSAALRGMLFWGRGSKALIKALRRVTAGATGIFRAR